MTIHQWAVIIMAGIVLVIVLLALLAPLAQFMGGYSQVFLGLFMMLLFKVGPFALLAYGIWAFFIEPRAA